MPDRQDISDSAVAEPDLSWLGAPIEIRALFAKQHTAYIQLLRSLDDRDWVRPTGCPGWSVQDIAAHVLGDHVGRLSIQRDGHKVLNPVDGESFPAFIARINDEWVSAARRISPKLLTDMSASTGDQIVQFWNTVEMHTLSWPVSWAGPDPAPAWLDAARDFTEYWTHQQQICEATNRIGLTEPEYLGPVLDTFLRALPHTLRCVTAPLGTTLEMTVTGPSGGTWACTRMPDRWALRTGSRPNDPDARIELDADTTWHLCTRKITPAQAAEHARTEGNQRIATAALEIVSIVH